MTISFLSCPLIKKNREFKSHSDHPAKCLLRLVVLSIIVFTSLRMQSLHVARFAATSLYPTCAVSSDSWLIDTTRSHEVRYSPDSDPLFQTLPECIISPDLVRNGFVSLNLLRIVAPLKVIINPKSRQEENIKMVE